MKFSRDFFLQYSQKYDEKYKGTEDSFVEKELKNWFSKYRYLTRDKFIKLGLWKSRRPRRHYEDSKNTDKFVKNITSLAFKTSDERERIELLLSMNNGIKGVSWPVASVILHFAFPEKYPIMDYRVIWSLGWQQPKNYTFEFWQKYVKKLKNLSKKFNLSLRIIDKALWFYSKEKQKQVACNDEKGQAVKGTSQTISFISKSKIEDELFKKYTDKFVWNFWDFNKKYGGFTDTDIKKIGKKLDLAMGWEHAVISKAQEVRFCFVKTLVAFKIWENNKNSRMLFQYLEWVKYFSFNLYIYKEFLLNLVNVLFPEIYGYVENTIMLEKQMRTREERNSLAEIPVSLRKLFSYLDNSEFKGVLKFRNHLTHKDLLQIIISYSYEDGKYNEKVSKIIKGKRFAQREKVDPMELLKKIQKAYNCFTTSCAYLGKIYSKKLEKWSITKGVIGKK